MNPGLLVSDRLFLPSPPRMKFQIDSLGDHLSTCTVHSGVKKAHDWVVDQITDLFKLSY
jgi:hypothetical protein